MDKTDEYIKEKMSFFASNIDDFEVGDQVIDLDGSLCTIIDKSLNTIMVSIGRKSSLGLSEQRMAALSGEVYITMVRHGVT